MLSRLDWFYITVAIGNMVVPCIMIIRNKRFSPKEKTAKILKTILIMGIIAAFVIGWVLYKNGYKLKL